jgi:hypothetical protein
MELERLRIGKRRSYSCERLMDPVVRMRANVPVINPVTLGDSKLELGIETVRLFQIHSQSLKDLNENDFKFLADFKFQSSDEEPFRKVAPSSPITSRERNGRTTTLFAVSKPAQKTSWIS